MDSEKFLKCKTLHSEGQHLKAQVEIFQELVVKHLEEPNLRVEVHRMKSDEEIEKEYQAVLLKEGDNPYSFYKPSKSSIDKKDTILKVDNIDAEVFITLISALIKVRKDRMRDILNILEEEGIEL